jgi:ATP-binding cassette, subfamily F, member 3
VISIKSLSFRIGERLLFDEAAAMLPGRSRVGIVGRNGVGKSTLFRLVMGEQAPESGAIEVPAGARIGTVSQHAPTGEGSLVDIVLRGDAEREHLLSAVSSEADPVRLADLHERLTQIGAHSAPARAAMILHGLGFQAADQARPIRDFSSGWRMRVALAVALFSEPDLLLLDEPTNYLDIEGVLWLQEHLARYPHTLLIISHDRDFLDVAADHILHLEAGKLTTWRGNYSAFERQYAERAILAEKAQASVDSERARLQAFVDRFKAKASKASQARSRMKRLEKLADVPVIRREGVQRIHLRDPEKPLASPLVAIEKANAGYGPRIVLKGVSLSIGNEDRIGLLGANGNGKSTLVNLIAGRLPPLSGHVAVSPRLKVATFSPLDLEALDGADTPLAIVRRHLGDGKGDAEVRGTAAMLGFPAQKVGTPCAQLSGGEKTRLVMGLALLQGPHLVILDEPTNHLDIEARDSLVSALAGYKGASIIVSHDRRLLEMTSDRLWLVRNGAVQPFDGDLDDYRKLVAEENRQAEPREERKSGNDGEGLRSYGVSMAKRSDLKALRAELQRAEAEIERLSSLLARLDALLADPAIYATDAVKAQRMASDRKALQERIAATEEKWLEAGAAIEAAG